MHVRYVLTTSIRLLENLLHFAQYMANQLVGIPHLSLLNTAVHSLLHGQVHIGAVTKLPVGDTNLVKIVLKCFLSCHSVCNAQQQK